jgi:hypothetical protein
MLHDALASSQRQWHLPGHLQLIETKPEREGDADRIRGSAQSWGAWLAGQDVDVNLRLLMFSCRIFLSRVERGIPSLAAAPVGPATFPLLSANAASMIIFS